MSAPQGTSSPTAKDRTIVLSYNQPLDPTSVPTPADFTATGSQAPTNLTEASVTIVGSNVYLGIVELMAGPPNVITLSYSGTAIRNAQGEAAATFTNLGCQNSGTGTDGTAPSWLTSSFSVSEETLDLYLDEVLGFGPPPASAFIVRSTLSGKVSVLAVDLVETYGNRIRLTLERAVSSSEVITVQYVVPASQSVRDGNTNEAVAFSATAVTNSTSPRAVLSYLTWWRADELAGQMDADEVASYLAATRDQKRRDLKKATADINGQKWQGAKYDPTQSNEFPRVANPSFSPQTYLNDPRLNWPAYPSIGDSIWDVDANGVAVVPAAVNLACLYQANSVRAGRGASLAAQHDGLSAQAAGPISESYVGTSAGSAAPMLCNAAWELLKRYQLVSGQML
jgi:hypothetical protein